MTPLRIGAALRFAGALGLFAGPLTAQTPTNPGQAAFGSLSEIVRLLEADPKTDWSKVDLDALRNHLIDMDNLTLRARAAATPIPGGIRLDITGPGETGAAVRRMIPAHADALNSTGSYRASSRVTASGVVLEVTSIPASDARAVAKLRALGCPGLMTVGTHHATHHLALARGAGADAHRHQ
jgi:hypothetical protein